MARRRSRDLIRRRTRIYKVFLGFQFQSNHFAMSELLSMAEGAVEIAKLDLRKKYPWVDLKLDWEGDKGEPLNSAIIKKIQDASAGIFELTDKNANVYYELGRAHATGVRAPILLTRDTVDSRTLVASDVRDIIRLSPYTRGQLEGIKGRVARRIMQHIEAEIRKELSEDQWFNVRRVWRGTSHKGQAERIVITVVCPELPPRYRPDYGERTSMEFVNLARYGDLDTLFEVTKILTKITKNVEFHYMTSKEVRPSDLRGNLVVIGGPDFNSLARTFVKEQAFPFRYAIEKGGVPVLIDKRKEQILRQENTPAGRIIKDYGLFAALANPYNSQSRVVVIGGLHTYGVLGAAQAFDTTRTGMHNADAVLSKVSGSALFACTIPIPVKNARPCEGKVDLSSIYRL